MKSQIMNPHKISAHLDNFGLLETIRYVLRENSFSPNIIFITDTIETIVTIEIHKKAEKITIIPYHAILIKVINYYTLVFS